VTAARWRATLARIAPILIGSAVPLAAQDRGRVLFVDRARPWSLSFVLVMPLAPLVPRP
jgi:hypothetical protein